MLTEQAHLSCTIDGRDNSNGEGAGDSYGDIFGARHLKARLGGHRNTCIIYSETLACIFVENFLVHYLLTLVNFVTVKMGNLQVNISRKPMESNALFEDHVVL